MSWDDYYAEQEEQQREQENRPSPAVETPGPELAHVKDDERLAMFPSSRSETQNISTCWIEVDEFLTIPEGDWP